MPIQKQASLVFDLLNSCPDISIILFSGRNQKNELKPFYQRFEERMSGNKPNLFFSGDITKSIAEELSLMRELSLMVSMDSANMHLAALVGIPVVGLFGTTHPYLGFIPYLQGDSGTYGVKDLVCRPCTVFGKGTCYRGDFACMVNLDSETVLSKIKDRLSY
jgi:ADP-heptose:LPS heptosyltransferase